MTAGLAALALLLAACGNGDAGEDGAAAPESDAESDAESDFPQENIRLIVPFGAGGGYDTQARLIAPYLAEHLPNNVNVVVDNVPGGDGVLGPQTVFNADPDGYTILQAGVNSLMIVQALQPDVITYDMTEFSWIGQYQEDIRGVAIANDLEVETWDDLVAISQEQPLRLGGNGAGSPPTTEGIALSALTELEIEVIDYEGSAELQAAFARGELDIAVVNYTSLVRWEDDGDARLFLVLADERGEYAPDAPTALEAGIPEDEYESIAGLPVIGQPRMFAAPPETPDEILTILRDAFDAVMEDEDYLATLVEQQEIHAPLTGDEAVVRVEEIAEGIAAESALIEELYGE